MDYPDNLSQPKKAAWLIPLSSHLADVGESF
jgi:hypothetical protein